MSGYKRVSKEIKDEILAAVKEGQKVKDIADNYGISVKSVYSWLKKQADRGGGALEISRLKRENEALKYLVGEFALEIKRQGKKRKDLSYA